MKHKIIFALIMGMITTGLVSFTLTSYHVGFGDRFLGRWLTSWSIAIAPALFSILFISPKILRLVNTIAQKTIIHEER